ncbi:hypothetical protein A5714_09680 [Mycobacterium sp. E2462]|uniref:hypothetical protein n=1 Tax=Mycobacterium sp. E2462 TaxID=1834133 RepID=UPI000801C168|nr:hypothetical protein [Mycobacterium sp. E2462]OBI18702.1 hypothetical protein A5714_09680 [Mycobacterium sp. E2462]
MTTAIAARETVENDPAQAHDDVTLAVAMLNAVAGRGATATDVQPRWRATEEEILRAAITVILVALMAVIGVAASAILTMG